MPDLSTKVVAVTGAARGIGLATARAFAEAGAVVALGDLDADLAERAAADLGGKAVGLRLDVTDPASFEAFLAAAEDALGPLDVLVNNAGIMPTGLFADESAAMTDRVIDINLRGVIIGARLAVERFIPRGSGHLINISSLAGVSAFPGLATYCATKHAVVGFTEALHRELGPRGITATAVLPGVVRTDLSAGAKTPRWISALSTVDPSDVAAAIVGAVGRNRPQVTVPRRLGWTLKVMSALPYRARRVAERVTGADTAYTQPDPAAREVYHRRLREQS
jgi:NAD(P)-dependent dehydrogenase (short-subunit alcohol dehydrogenase family)